MIKVSNGLVPDQDQHSVRPYLGLNCLQRLSAGDICRQRIKTIQVWSQVRAYPGSEFVVLNTLAKWKKLEPNAIDFILARK